MSYFEAFCVMDVCGVDNIRFKPDGGSLEIICYEDGKKASVFLNKKQSIDLVDYISSILEEIHE